MALLKRLVVGGLRVYKPKIQATKPKDTGKMVADGVVIVAAVGAIAEIMLRLKHKNAQEE